MIKMPKTILGKWSVGLNAFFLVVVITSVILVEVLNKLSFDDRWWDVIAGIVFPASIIAFIIGIIAKRKYQDRSISVFVSILLGLCVILFIVFHSLFITD